MADEKKSPELIWKVIKGIHAITLVWWTIFLICGGYNLLKEMLGHSGILIRRNHELLGTMLDIGLILLIISVFTAVPAMITFISKNAKELLS